MSRIIVFGGDGFCGWPISLRLSSLGYDVTIVDDLSRRVIDVKLGCESLTPIKPADYRVLKWRQLTGNTLGIRQFDISRDYEALVKTIDHLRPMAVVHLAEQRAAPYSMKGPYEKRYTVNNNISATNNLLVAISDLGIDTHVVHIGCYDDQTEIFTDSGWKLFKDLKDEDKVATRTEYERTLVFKKPKSIHEFNYNGQMYRVKNNRLDLSVTPDHRMFNVKRSNTDYKELRMEIAKDAYAKRRVYDIGFEWNGEDKDYFSVVGKNVNAINYLRFLGWFLSEGTISPDSENGSPRNICIKQNKGISSDILNKDIKNFCEDLSLNYTVRSETKKLDCYRVFGTEIAKEFSILGKSKDKYIPDNVKDLNKLLLKELLNTMLLGDGSKHRKGFRYHTVSERLANDVQEISLKVGYAANIRYSTKYKRYVVNISKSVYSHVNHGKQSDYWKGYTGKIHCVDIGDGHGIVFVRRNGKPFWSGNTMGVYGYGGLENFYIPEGYVDMKMTCGITGQSVTPHVMFPSDPGSVYHMTKVLDSHMFYFYNKNDGLKITDLHQGIVWGTQTEETSIHEDLINRFDYDGDYGTVLNRFIMQGIIGHPITVYGSGERERAFIHISDTVECIRLAIENPPSGDCVRIINQTTEQLNLNSLARMISKRTGAEIKYCANPRKEADRNNLLTTNKTLLDLGLNPKKLDDDGISEIFEVVKKYRKRADISKIMPTSFWTKEMK